MCPNTQVRGHPNIVGMLGVCGASSVSEYYGTHLDDLVLTPGAKPLPISSVVSFFVLTRAHTRTSTGM